MLSTKQFIFNKQTNTFIAEISELEHSVSGHVFKQIYPDACDRGFTLVSHVTGVAIDFVECETDYSSDRSEITGWRFIVAKQADLRKYGNLKALIIND